MGDRDLSESKNALGGVTCVHFIGVCGVSMSSLAMLTARMTLSAVLSEFPTHGFMSEMMIIVLIHRALGWFIMQHK